MNCTIPSGARPIRVARRSLALTLVAGTALAIAGSPALAGPKGERVVKGSVQIERNGTQTVIRASNKAVINFDSFNVGAGESVQFVQPGAKSRVLNRVTGSGPSKIDGELSANGRVYIVNPAGVIFGAGSVVNAAGLVAAAGELSNRDFLAGVDRFTNVTGDISAQGLITADAVHMIGQRVANAGTIVADDGVVSLLVGSDVMLRERGGQIMVRIDGRELDTGAGPSVGSNGAVDAGVGVENSGEIRAARGAVTLGAGDAYSLAIRNTGSVRTPGGEITVSAGDGLVRNEGVLSASVEKGAAGRVVVQGPRVENAGEVSADAQAGRAGAVEVTSAHSTILADGSRVSARGGVGVATGGEALVHSYDGDTTMRAGASVDVSGGAAGGDGGWAEVSAGRRLAVDGQLRGEAQSGFKQASLLLDPFNIVIATPGAESGQVSDGQVLAGEDPGATWHISPGAIEGFAGNVRLEATNDIYVTENINKVNGGLTFLAGRDISFSTEVGGLLPSLAISANFIDFTAGRNIVDRAITRTGITSTVGNITLEATTGSIKTGFLTVQPGGGVSLTQAQSRFIGAGPFGLLSNPGSTNLAVNITNGFLVFGGDFGGVSGAQSILSVDAQSTDFLRIEDNLTIGSFANFRSFADVQIDGFVHSGGALSFHGAMDGIGAGPDGSLGVHFLSPALSVRGSSIAFRAGNGAEMGPGVARVNVVTNGPSIGGVGGAATRPEQFTIRQDAELTDANLPSGAQFGAPLSGMQYRAQSDAGSVTVATSSKVQGTALTLSGADGSTIGGALAVQSLLVEGVSRIGADVTSTTFQTYQGASTLSADVTLTGAAISFQGTLDSAGVLARALIANVNSIYFGGAVGGANALERLTVNGATTLAGGSVRTNGDQRFNGSLTLANHAALRSLNDGVIRFGSTVDGPYDLMVRTTPGGLIVFAGDVGGAAALRDLTLSTAGADSARPPAKEATIVGETSLAFRVRDFTMGQNEKFTTLGTLDLQATRAAQLGDLVTSGSMHVAAPQITLLLRPAGTLTDDTGATETDLGLDYVSGGTMTFTGAVILGGIAGSPAPTFGAVLGAGTGAGPAGFDLLAMSPADTSIPALTFEGRVLDQKTPPAVVPPTPPNEGDVSADLAGAVPEPPEFNDYVLPEAYELSVLSRIAVLGRGVSDSEAVGALSGRALYSDMPAAINDFGAERTTVATRISRRAATRTSQQFDAVFGVPGEERFDEIGQTIAGSLDRFLSTEEAASTDPAAFRRYVAAAENEQATQAYLDGIAALLTELRGLGLTAVEYQEAQRRILSAIVAPGGPSVEMLTQILEADPDRAASNTDSGADSKPRG